MPKTRKPTEKTPEKLAIEKSLEEFRDAFYECMIGLGFQRAEEWRTPVFLSCITKDDVEINAGSYLSKKNNLKLRAEISIPIANGINQEALPCGFRNVLGMNNKIFPLATVSINSKEEVCDKIAKILELYEKAKKYIDRHRDSLMKVWNSEEEIEKAISEKS